MKTFSSETLSCLRNCSLLEKGTYEGKVFVRCIPTSLGCRRLDEPLAHAQATRVVAEVKDPGVVLAFHPYFGPYVRVETNSKTFLLICEMKS